MFIYVITITQVAMLNYFVDYRYYDSSVYYRPQLAIVIFMSHQLLRCIDCSMYCYTPMPYWSSDFSKVTRNANDGN